jgi:hypothetical protein
MCGELRKGEGPLKGRRSRWSGGVKSEGRGKWRK